METHKESEVLGPPDWVLLSVTVGLISLGLMMVYSSTFDLGYRLHEDPAFFFKRQMIWLGLGAVGMFIAARIHYKHWMKLSIPIMALVLALLIALVIFGRGRHLIGQSISPVELAKLAVIVYIGHWLASKRVEQLRRLPVGPLPFSIIVGVVAGLVMAQPDTSEAVIIVLVAAAMFFLAGAHLVQFVVAVVGGIAAFALVIRQIPMAVERLAPFLNDWRNPLVSTNDQLRQGLIALGSGGLFGLGPGSGRMSYRWLPAAHTDSIFAIIGEELGLLGCVTVIGLFALLAYRGFQIAGRSRDPFGVLLTVGITCWITFQAVVNMAVVTGTIPFTGIALPFVSLGGSSLVTCMVGVGIMLSVSRVAPVTGDIDDEARGVGWGNRWSRLSRTDSHRNAS
ncbi:FtsW/RodA/SpoVE family cell cycle protein [Chloroflexota bacterium]